VIFDNLEVAPDGGMSEIGSKPELWYCTRYLSSVVVLLFVAYNIYFVASTDIDVLMNDGASHCDDVNVKTTQNDVAVHCYFYLSTSLINAITGIKFQYATQLICGMELALLAFFILRIFYRMYEIACPGCVCTAQDLAKAVADRASIDHGGHHQDAYVSWHHPGCVCEAGYVRWSAASNLCWELIPDISYFSAMMLLNFITPQVLSEDFNHALWYVTPNSKRLRGIAWIIVTRPLALFIGLDCFLLKVRSAHDTLFAEGPLSLERLLSLQGPLRTIVLLNQIVGVVQLRWAVQGRLYRFVFAGEDGVMTDRENVRMKTWNAMVAERIWQKYSKWQAVALMLTWNTDDFQLLVLNEPEDEAQQRAAATELTPTATRLSVPLVSSTILENLESGAA